MAKKPPNAGKTWSPADIKQLQQEVNHNTPTRVIALHMGRTPESIYAKVDSGGRRKLVNSRTNAQFHLCNAQTFTRRFQTSREKREGPSRSHHNLRYS